MKDADRMLWYLILTLLLHTASTTAECAAHRHRHLHQKFAHNFETETSPSPTPTAPKLARYVATGSSPAALTPFHVITSSLKSGFAQIATSLSGSPPDTTGKVITSLNTTWQATQPPLLTKAIPTPTTLLSASPAAVTVNVAPVVPFAVRMAAVNIFADPIATTAPASKFTRRTDHPVPRTGITSLTPYPTNKFFSNMYLGGLTSPAYLHPYAVHWAKGGGAAESWGLSISHVEPSQRVFGPAEPITGANKYFINPIHIQSMVLSAVELQSSTVLAMNQLTAFSAMVELRGTPRVGPAIRFPLIQGAGFITAIYNGATPLIGTGVHFRSATRATQAPQPGVVKYEIRLEDNTRWLLYARHTRGNALDLQLLSSRQLKSKGPFFGTIQVAKDPGNGESVYDQACGAYATTTELSGSVSGTSGSYTFTFKREGAAASKLLVFALPHAVDGFAAATRQGVTALKLQTTTKGAATGVLADAWTIQETLATGMGFLPWHPDRGQLGTLSQPAKLTILKVAQQELSQDIDGQSNLDSMYFSGKALGKFACIVLVVNDMLGDTSLAQAGLTKLKAAFARFAENRQRFPLFYESAWGGIVSSASYVTGQPGIDFGNTYYNDHHFHYGYFVYTAAVIGKLDQAWLAANKDYVNTLVRDFANPSPKDGFFTVYRNFDWYHGHSWAHGLYDTLDGNDQESSSEDAMSAYALKLWGRTIGDDKMAARGELQLATLARALKYYYLYTTDNTVQPASFIGNKVAGILFENKIDHTTFFGNNLEYIQGIHMIPVMPFSPLVRSDRFVREEWETYFDNGRVDAVNGGWRGILMANSAQVNARTAFGFFGSPNFDASHLDGGASRTWYMAYTAALAGL